MALDGFPGHASSLPLGCNTPTSQLTSSLSSSAESLPLHERHGGHVQQSSWTLPFPRHPSHRSSWSRPSRWLKSLKASDSDSVANAYPGVLRITVAILFSCSVFMLFLDGWPHTSPFSNTWIAFTFPPTPSSDSSTPWNSLSQSYRGPLACDPFLEPGSVIFNQTFHNDVAWVPYGAACPTSPDYLSSLRHIRSISNKLPLEQKKQLFDAPVNPSEQPDPDSAQFGHDRARLDRWGRPYPSLNFLHGKTVLILGDSVDRNALEHLYHLVGARVRSLSYTDVDSEPSPEWDRRSTPWEVDLGLLGHVNRDPSLDFNKKRPEGEFAGLNCRFVNGFFYGLDDIDEFAVQSDWHRPGKVEDRIKELYQPMTTQFASHSSTGEGPAFISVQSGLWDLAFFGRRSKKANATIEAPLSPEDLDWYQGRYRSMIRTLKATYPYTPIWVRMTHRVGEQMWASHDWQAGIKGGLGKGFVNFFTDVRVHQIRQVQLHVAQSEGLPVFDFGNIWEGYQKYQDKVHPHQVPGGVLMNQAMLHHVWLESIGRENWDPKLRRGLGPLPHRV